MQIHISNLNRKTSGADIRHLFSEFGTITVGKMSYVLDLRTRLAIGYVLVDVENDTAATMAIEKLNGSLLEGNTIKVKRAG